VPLLSDWNCDATRAFDVAQDYRGFRNVSARSVFVVDSSGVVRYARVYENDEIPDFEDALAAASDLAESAAQ
jgi:peroxiredoxin